MMDILTGKNRKWKPIKVQPLGIPKLVVVRTKRNGGIPENAVTDAKQGVNQKSGGAK